MAKLTQNQVSTVAMRVMFPLVILIDFDREDKTWFNPLVFDAAYLHLTVFAAEAFFNVVLLQETPVQNQAKTRHFVKGVQLLRERFIRGDEEAKVSDSTAMVVLMLAMCADFTGDSETSKQHMEGLRKIVDIRGGIEAFRDKKLLTEMFR